MKVSRMWYKSICYCSRSSIHSMYYVVSYNSCCFGPEPGLQKRAKRLLLAWLLFLPNGQAKKILAAKFLLSKFHMLLWRKHSGSVICGPCRFHWTSIWRKGFYRTLWPKLLPSYLIVSLIRELGNLCLFVNNPFKQYDAFFLDLQMTVLPTLGDVGCMLWKQFVEQDRDPSGNNHYEHNK